MNQLKRFGFLFLTAASFLASCKPSEGGEQTETDVMLYADRKEITADGSEKVIFTVEYDKADVTAQAQIVEVGSGQAVTDHSFSTDKEGTYKFKATYEGKESEEVTVTAVPVSGLRLTADKESILNNGTDKVTFTVTYEGKDVTQSADIINLTKGLPLGEGVNEFASTTSGEYEFKAGYDKMTSNIVKVKVSMVPLNALVLESNTPRIAANGTDKAIFTVLYQGEDVTSEAKIKDLSTNQYLTSNEFSYSGTLKTVDFVAEYKDVTSEPINIGFGDFYKDVLLVRFTGTWCGPCTALGTSLAEAMKTYPDRLQQIAVHVQDIYTSFDYSDFASYFPGTSVPRMYFDFEKPGYDRVIAAAEIVDAIKSHQEVDAKCGIAASSIMDGRTARVKVSVTAQTAGAYYLGVALVEDGLVGPQNGTTNYIHDNTLRTLATSISGEPLGELAVNQPVEREYALDLNDYTDNCRVIVYVNTFDGSVYSTTNTISCPVNGSVDYRFEE